MKSWCIMQGALPRLCENLEGWDGVGGAMEFQEGGDMCIPMTDSC